MSTVTDTTTLAGLLDRVSRLYPFGVPKQFLKPEACQVAGEQSRCALLHVGEDLNGNQKLTALAEAICTKGLRLSLEHCVLRSVSEAELNDQGLASLVAKIGAPVVIVCKESDQAGSIEELNGAVVLTSFPLNQIVDNVDVKRKFWEHLKLIIPRLHEKVSQVA